MVYDLESQTDEWRRVPVDDVGYLDSRDLLKLSTSGLQRLIRRMEATRYHGWRNHNNLWRDTLGLDTTKGKHVLDFGCGIGLEALQFARNNCPLTLVDLSWSNLRLARRVVWVHTDAYIALSTATDEYPYFQSDPIDVFYANGSLHHVPYAREVLLRALELLREDGEIRLMLYSDRARDLFPHDFVRAMDEVGSYADWYDRRKILEQWGDFLELKNFTYITPDERYCTAILTRRVA